MRVSVPWRRLLRVDLHAGELHVRQQWTRLAEYAPPKTRAAVRRVPLSPDILKYLTEHKLASRFSKDDEPVFASESGRPLGRPGGRRDQRHALAIRAALRLRRLGVRGVDSPL
jgi:integrase